MVNIFVTDKNPVTCAIALDNKRLPRMIWETSEIICAVHWNILLGIDKKTPKEYLGEKYPHYHPNLARRKHPVVLWTGKCRENYEWLLRYFWALQGEYKIRYAKEHKSYLLVNEYAQKYAKRLKWATKAKYYAVPEFAATITPKEILNLKWPVISRYKLAMLHKFLYLDERDSKWGTKRTFMKEKSRNSVLPPKWLFNKRARRWLRKVYGKPVNNPYELSWSYYNEVYPKARDSR